MSTNTIDTMSGATAEERSMQVVDKLVEDALTELVDSDVMELRPYAFYDKQALESVELPKVTTVGSNAFQNCSNLKSVVLDGQSKALGNYAFSNCPKLTDVSLPNLAASTGTYVFQNNYSLKSINLPKVTSLGQYAFDGCYNLESVSVPSLTKTSGTPIGNYAFQHCTALHEWDFSGYTSTVLGTSSANNQYKFAFSGLMSAELPNITAIGPYFFNNCPLLQTIDFSNTTNALTIGANAFANAFGLANLIIRKSNAVATLSNVNALSGTLIGLKYGYIYVPSDLVDSYKSASNWSTYADQIVSIDEYPKTITIEEETISDSWATIASKGGAGNYTIGAVKNLPIGNVMWPMQVALNKEGTSTVFVSKYLYGMYKMMPTNTTEGGWATCMMRKMLEGLYMQIDSDVRNLIKTRTSYYKRNDSTSTAVESCEDKLFILNAREANLSGYETSGDNYNTLFTSVSTRIKTLPGQTSGQAWWIRSAFSSANFVGVYGNGGADGNGAGSSVGAVFGLEV